MQAQSLAFSNPAPSWRPQIVEPSEVKIIGVARTYRRDQEIFGEGEAADLVFKVVSGAVRCLRILVDGRRQISEFYLPGDVFGIDVGMVRNCNAEAVGETVLVVARRSALMADEPAQGARLWRLAIAELRRSRDHAVTLGRRTAHERVARFLLDLAERLDTEEIVELPMSRQDIADFLGLTIETVSRTFTQLQARGLIRLNGCRLVSLIEPAVLTELCE